MDIFVSAQSVGYLGLYGVGGYKGVGYSHAWRFSGVASARWFRRCEGAFLLGQSGDDKLTETKIQQFMVNSVYEVFNPGLGGGIGL